MLYTDFASGIRWDKKPWTGVQLEEGTLNQCVEYTVPTDRWTVTTGKIQGEDRRFIQISVKSKSSLQLLHSTLKLFNHPVKCSVYMYLANSYLYPP